MDVKEELNSGAKITSLSMSVENWGEKEGQYNGTIKFKVGEDTLEMKVNHEFCKILLTNSYKLLKGIIQTSGIQIIKDILDTKSPISKSKKELENEGSSNKDSNKTS